VLHVIPRGYVVDGQEGVKDPLGMSAVRLEVETHIVHASATAVQNLSKCVQRAEIKIDELVASALAAGDAVLSETERELGVAVADFGAGTIDLALFLDGSPFHTAVLPLGGNNVTNDVAIGLKTSLAAAEELKIIHGTADPASVEKDEQVDVETIGEGGRTASKRELAEIIEARMREVFEKIGDEISRSGNTGKLPAGLVMTGGAAQLAGAAQLGREVLQMPVRVAGPTGVSGLTDHLLTPAFSTSLGLLLWGARAVRGYEPLRYESASAPGVMARMREWLRSLAP
jgi:cell division protein FtsA